MLESMIEAFDMLHLKEIGCLCVTRIYGYMHGHVSEVNSNVTFLLQCTREAAQGHYLDFVFAVTEQKALCLHTFALGTLGHAL